ncbi:MAG: hypothetical protein D5R96_04875 [Methanocalculus sp. MSAO_Arc2]|nr:MAG: hypothetical protein D5R96_04875 [Methanocalculus sp. MSAO_Arc2]
MDSDMVEVPYTLIQRVLQKAESELETVVQALSMAQEDFSLTRVGLCNSGSEQAESPDTEGDFLSSRG